MVNTLIIQACKQKEHQALKQCYEACAPYVYTIIKNYIHNTEDRKDVLQEAFAHIFNSMERYDEEKGSFKTWIAQITINQSINFLKKNNKLSLLTPLGPEHEKEELDLIESEKIDKKALERCMAKMPSGYRTVFNLYMIDGYAHDEIASILEVSSQTSRSQLSRALKWLKVHYPKHLKSVTYG